MARRSPPRSRRAAKDAVDEGFAILETLRAGSLTRMQMYEIAARLEKVVHALEQAGLATEVPRDDTPIPAIKMRNRGRNGSNTRSVAKTTKRSKTKIRT